MKNVKVNAYQVGLVFKNGEYKRMLTAGNYWFWGNEVVHVYEINRLFTPPVELNILLQDKALADILHVIEVKDNEIVLMYENDLLKQVLTAGRYAYWKSVIRYEFVHADTSKLEITEPISRETLVHRLVSPYVRAVTVESHEKVVLFIDGKYDRVLNGGIYYMWKNSIVVQIARVDTRQQQLEINGQEILTRDKAALRINAWAQYKVTDIEKAVLQNKEYDKQLYVAFQLALREYVAGFNFDELLDKKET
ncbi:MAG TPA: SPFH domain-containing protein, partial [Chitinophagaceae bacterium]|nr:SPFH domain-containing protein [Chitinophagaceae bacterium]